MIDTLRGIIGVPASRRPRHHYEITVYAVKVAHLPRDNTALDPAVSSRLHSNTLTPAKIVERYERSK
jgi:phosphatidylethanolamine-binding protein (PEBP) family uncharacterized protein